MERKINRKKRPEFRRKRNPIGKYLPYPLHHGYKELNGMKIPIIRVKRQFTGKSGSQKKINARILRGYGIIYKGGNK